MNNNFVRQIEAVVNAVDIKSPTAFDFEGERKHVPLLAIESDTRRQHHQLAPIIHNLQQSIYYQCYARQVGRPHSNIPQVQTSNSVTSASIVEVLSSANQGRNRQETGWQIVEVLPAGKIVAQRGGVARRFWPGEYVSESGPGMPPVVGSAITAYYQREGRGVQAGFYFAYGEHIIQPTSPYEVVRYYFNITAEGAAVLMRQLTSRLNHFEIPFRLKCVNHVAHFDRIDTAVLYVHARYYRIVAEILADSLPILCTVLQEETPILTRHLAPGIAFAEEPATGESFGMSRSRLIAEALWSAYDANQSSTTEKIAAVVKHFSTCGLSLDAPYLREGSTNYYLFPILD